MSGRRAPIQRPVTSEEVQYWAHASDALATFRERHGNSTTSVGKVNRTISAWPSDSYSEPFETVKDTYKKLSSGLSDLKSTAEEETRAIDKAVEALSVLIALRRAPESAPQIDKRNKRHRGSSPLSGTATPVPTPLNKITLSMKADRERASEGPIAHLPYKGDAKARPKMYNKQQPLQEGRKVAFHPPSASGSVETDENTWILAVVTRCISQEKQPRYEVQDVEPQEDGQPGQIYHATLKSIVPLPDPEAATNSPSHPNSYPVFPAGSAVMALYPDTSCFYRAEVTEVVQGTRDSSARSNAASKQYRLRFEDDDDQIHSVSQQWVVEWPGT